MMKYPVVNVRPAASYPDFAFLTSEDINASAIRDAFTKGTQVQVTPRPEENFNYMNQYNAWVAAKAARAHP